METLVLPVPLPAAAGDVVPVATLLLAGMSRAQIRTALKSGTLVQLRRGWFWLRPQGHTFAADLFRAQITAAVLDAQDRDRELVLAGTAAAVWLRLPWFSQIPSHITVAGPQGSGRVATDLLARIGDIGEENVVREGGALVTSPARTVLDAARLTGTRQGLAIMDAALNRGLVTAEQIQEQLTGMERLTGADTARWCASHADGLAESPGESISRHAMILAGLPRPELQHLFILPSGRRARTDFYWLRGRLVGECDGLVKYRANAPSGNAEQALIDEKLREDGLRALGERVTRWTWGDASNPARLIARITSLLAHR